MNPDPLDPQDVGFQDTDLHKYADSRIRIQGSFLPTEKYQKKFLLTKPKSEPLKKRNYKNIPISKRFHLVLAYK